MGHKAKAGQRAELEGHRELERTEWEGQADEVEPAFMAKAKNKR